MSSLSLFLVKFIKIYIILALNAQLKILKPPVWILVLEIEFLLIINVNVLVELMMMEFIINVDSVILLG